ncbi:MAG: hypothetical protein ACOCX1_01305 [Fimbriimonadaceae bacterium]
MKVNRSLASALTLVVGLVLSTVAAAQAEPDYPVVEQPYRLALSPLLDGQISAEEWEPYWQSEEAQTYFQWEPGTVHWAAVAPGDEDVVLSIDAGNDGWRQGKDNYEIRVSMQSELEAEVTLRYLDYSAPLEPEWVNLPLVPQNLIVVPTMLPDGRWSVEATWRPEGLFSVDLNDKMGVLVDTVPADARRSDVGARPLPVATLVFDSGQNVPTGMMWDPNHRLRTIPAGDSFTAIYEITKSEAALELSRIAFRVEGLAEADTATMSRPAPEFGDNSRVTVEYETPVAREATPGYRIARLEATTESGQSFTMRSSFKVAELLDFISGIPEGIAATAEPQKVTGFVRLESNALGSLRGTFQLIGPPGWNIVRGAEDRFLIYHERGEARIGIEFLVPGGLQGTYPLVLRARIGERVVEETIPFTIGEP